MKIGNKFKKLISLLAVLIILVSITITPAHADILSNAARQRLGAMIASALMALNITLNSVIAPYQSMLDYIPDALGLPTATWDDDYLDRSTIQVWEDYIEIDGVQYTDIWLSTEAAEKFRTDGYDFKTAYNLVSNSNGTFVSGAGFADGIPLYYDPQNHEYYTQWYEIPSNANGTYDFGNGSVLSRPSTTNPNTTQYNQLTTSTQNQTSFTFQRNMINYPTWKCRYHKLNHDTFPSTVNWQRNYNNTTNESNNISGITTNTPFDFDWTSGTIPADEELPDGTGMMIRVPTDDVQDWINDNPTMVNTPVDIDVTLDPTITGKIDDLIDLIIPILANLQVGDITFVENHESPTPPVQDTLLPDTWWSQVVEKFDQVIETIQNISFQDVIQAIQTIPSAITQAVSNITQAISNLGDQIIQDIEQGPIKVFDKALDKLRDIFLPILLSLKSALGIWHYVVEWMGNISGTLTWYVSAFSGISSTLMSPIYAVIAGWIVIMVYRRFGR